mmetsp:Transcript_8278/g.16508  ORF Transcript_8278/g.16508 Transcript_8278/m.16508 type:complete len:89 (-) Transcript_8278:144-410(-)
MSCECGALPNGPAARRGSWRRSPAAALQGKGGLLKLAPGDVVVEMGFTHHSPILRYSLATAVKNSTSERQWLTISLSAVELKDQNAFS